jgi:uncharacterized protein DUF4279
MPKQVPPRGAPKGTIWVGGVVDETDVCLGVYGDDLDPDQVTVMLGCEPTSSHRKGDRTKRGIVRRRGAWLLSSKGTADPEELTCKLLDRLPKDERTWARLAKEYEVQLRFGLFLQRWNRGLDFTPQLVARMAKLHARIIFDVYGPDDAPVDVVERHDHRPVAAPKSLAVARPRKSRRLA